MKKIASTLFCLTIFCGIIFSQEDKYFQIESGSFKIYSDRGTVDGFNFRIGGGNIIQDYLELGFEFFYNRASFNDEIFIPTGAFILKGSDLHASGGLTGIGKVNLINLMTDSRSSYLALIEVGFGTTVSGYEIFAWHAMGGLTAGYEIDKNLSLFVSLKGFYYWSDKVIDDINFDQNFNITTDGTKDRYRTLNAGLRIVF